MSLYSIKRFAILLIISTLDATAYAAQPTQAEIEEAIGAATAQGRIIPVSTGNINIPATLQQLTSLPVVFRNTVSDYPYDIVVLGMSITPTGSVLKVGCRFEVPPAGSGVYLYFGAAEVAVSGKSGFSGEMSILESSLTTTENEDPNNLLGGEQAFYEFKLPALRNKLGMGLDKTTKVGFQCGEFRGFTLSGYLKIYEGVVKEDATGGAIADGKPLMLYMGKQQVYDWQDMFFKATVARAFRSVSNGDLGFHPTANTQVLIDLSNVQNPTGVPTCGGAAVPTWQGVSFDAFEVRLPRLFKLKPVVCVLTNISNSL